MDLHYFPFTAVVDQEPLKEALLVNAINPAVGGVLITGPSGTAKSTAARALSELLPEIEVVADCPFGCDPGREPLQCPDCSARAAAGGRLPRLRRRRRFVNLPLNATEDRVAGTVDITRALREGTKSLEPGLLAEANRGIIYVDEVNLLDDHLTDILLDAAALGVNVVEREGVSVVHPARFLLIGSMNPEEGELRPQIADRIGLHVDVQPLADPRQRAIVMAHREAFTRDPERFRADYEQQQADLQARLAHAESLLESVIVPEALYPAMARLVTRFGVQSHRADVTILEAAKALAALNGQIEVAGDDLRRAGRLALGHRIPVDPFAPVHLTDNDVDRALTDVLAEEVEPKKVPPTAGLA